MDNSYKFEYLYKAIEDAQNTIRFTDTKAAAILAFCGIFVATMTSIGNFMLNAINETITILLLVTYMLGAAFYILIFTAVFIAFKSINPMSSQVSHINNSLSTKTPFYLWKVTPKMKFVDLFIERNTSKLDYSTEEYLQKLSDESAEYELLKSLIIELHKVSYIREKKIFRVNRSIMYFKTSLVILVPLVVLIFYLKAL